MAVDLSAEKVGRKEMGRDKMFIRASKRKAKAPEQVYRIDGVKLRAMVVSIS
jgi:hypothetical protein